MSLLSNLFSAFKAGVYDYCELEAPYFDSKHKGIWATRDGGLISMYELKGSYKMLGKHGFKDILSVLTDELSKKLKDPGHVIEFVFIRDPEQSKDIVRKQLEPIRSTMKRLQLDLEGLINEREKVLSESLVFEKCLITIKTTPAALSRAQTKAALDARSEKAKEVGVKPGKYGQSPFVGLDALRIPHIGVCDSVIGTLKTQCVIEQFDHHEFITEIKKQVEPYSTSTDWKPSLLGDKISAKLVREVDQEADLSHLSNADIAFQIFGRKPQHADEDYSSVKHDNVYYAPLMIESCQDKPTMFGALFDNIPKEIPWRLNLTIKTGHDTIVSKLGSKRAFAGFLQFSNSNNKLIKDAAEELIDRAINNTLVSCQVSMCTWSRDYNELIERKEIINQQLQKWGSLDVIDELGDPIESWIGTLPALSTNKIAAAFPLPVWDVLYMLPLTRPYSPWEQGSMIFGTHDGKIYPQTAGSAIQKNTSELTYAPPGSGKSFKLSALNMALILKPGNTKLPRLKIIDIGFSSRAFVEMIQDALPEHLKYQAQAITLENRADRAINFFFTPLGNRHPLTVDKQAQANILELLLTPAGTKGTIPRLPEVCSALIDAAYTYRQDENTPNLYEPGMSDMVDEKLDQYGIEATEDTSWWSLVDRFFKRNEIEAASKCQSFAMPLLSDLTSLVQDSEIKGIYGDALIEGEKLLSLVSQMITSSLKDFPVLTQPSAIDVSSARILSIDLQNVAKKGGAQANKQAALMFLLARTVACNDFYVVEDTLVEINPDYYDYHRKKIEEEDGIPKKLAMDEFHRTRGFDQVRSQAEQDIREGRKYGVIVSLLSQSLEDFDKSMIEFATSIFVMAKGISSEVQKSIVDKLSPTADSMVGFRNFVRGPGKEGSTFLYIADVDETDGVEQILRLKLGAEEVWAYSTTPDDVALRRRLVKKIGLHSSLRILAKEFPSGSAKKYIESLKNQAQDVEEESVIAQIADRLIQQNANIV
ncbi:hypothetical protein J8A87_21500 [Vibrio parahaemolyticus]|uniref:ATP-binding protein n=1 Tax=Vibrio fluvialis PG41 TaxID=1336752 RepID=S7HXV0_VIBFL|nr:MULTISPECIES: hypothetical protein [Vibrio]EPP20487.1 hypothetical protein L910_1981 [Vibrio fluvialis PG41]MBE4779759.1 ATP-binding protein [Vibrio parahaemolyticus]MCF9167025.1 hypothetical protein [Vibrio parahaemolyticus]MDW1965398.1 hypothetical protein [Vibrio sp. Vb0587]